VNLESLNKSLVHDREYNEAYIEHRKHFVIDDGGVLWAFSIEVDVLDDIPLDRQPI
jgi:hypothetical protein